VKNAALRGWTVLALLAAATLAPAALASPHPFAGKSCDARAQGNVIQGSYTWSGGGKIDFIFAPGGTMRLKWTGDNGRTSGGDTDIPYVGTDGKSLVFRGQQGGTIYIDPIARSGLVRSSYFMAEFSQLKCK
jgi:hypothetical protein